MGRTLKILAVAAVLIVGTVMIAALAVGILLDRFVGLKEACHLEYRGRVTFSATCGEKYEIVGWSANDWTDPEPCPFVVHLPGGDLDAAHLGAIDRLKAEGWTVFDWGGQEVELYTQDRLVRCWFHGKQLTGVEVNVVPVQGRTIPPVSITFLGKKIAMPASEQAIIAALGPPVRAEKPAR